MYKTLARFPVIVVAALILAIVAQPQAAHATAVVRYVKQTGVSSGTCNTWGNACNLQYALGLAVSGNELWVAAGVYKPTSTTTRTIRFNVSPGVAVYGGFNGAETLLSQRDWTTNVTILSGDIDNNDANHTTTNIDVTTTDIVGANSYHVVRMDGTSTAVTSSTVLDGFTVTAGRANGADPDNRAGGLYCNGTGAGNECSPALSNLTFSGNLALYGGAIQNDGNGGTSSPTLTNVTFHGNRASGGWGGAVYNFGGNGGVSSPSFAHVTFSDNQAASRGGALYNDGRGGGVSSPSLMDVTFNGNTANYGGAIYDDGSGSSGHSNPTLANVTFYNNSADDGGAIYNNGDGGTSSPVLSNVTFSSNDASITGGALYNSGQSGGISSPDLTNVILWADSAVSSGNEIQNASASPTINHSVVQGGNGGIGGDSGLTAFSSGTGNLSTDPMLGSLASNGGFTQTMALGAGNSAIDMGNDMTCAAAPVNGLDQRGVTRPQGPHCDIGAYEYEYPPLKVMAVYPSDGSQACRRPQVGVDLQFADELLTSATLDPSAKALIFNRSTIHLTLDGVDKTSMAFIVMTMDHPASYSVLYIPPADLTVGSHQGRLNYPSAAGPASRIWNFTVANIACTTFTEAPSFPGPEQQGPDEP